MSSWNTEQEEQPQQQSLEYQVKAHLILEGSNLHEWGVVKDCHGCINYIPEDAEVVGTWNKYADGVFWVSLETPIMALADKATQLYIELAAKRREEVARPSRPSRALEVPPTPAPEAFDDL
ncbi:unnamed protein product, partial [marine sediment metagenome]